MEGVIFSIPILGALLLRLAKENRILVRSKIRRAVAALVLTLSLAGGWIGYYNWRVTGNPLLLPHLLNQRMYHTQALFLWQTAKPAHSYNNRQFDFFYNVYVRSEYHRTLEDMKRVTVDKFENFWSVFLGPIAVLPAMMLPWVIFDRRPRLLITVFVISWLGLITVVWSIPHYAAPYCRHLRFAGPVDAPSAAGPFRGPARGRCVGSCVRFDVIDDLRHMLLRETEGALRVELRFFTREYCACGDYQRPHEPAGAAPNHGSIRQEALQRLRMGLQRSRYRFVEGCVGAGARNGAGPKAVALF